MGTRWYVRDRTGAEFGPYTGSQLRSFAAEGRIAPDTLVRQDDMTQAVPARRIATLFPAATTASPAVRELQPEHPDLPQLSGPVAPPTARIAVPEAPALPSLAPIASAALSVDAPAGAAPVPAAAAFPPPRPPTATVRRPQAMTSDPPPAPARPATVRLAKPEEPPIPLGQPRWVDLWPLVGLMLVMGWMLGGGMDGETAYGPASGFWVLVLALAGVPAAFAAFLYWLRPRSVPALASAGSCFFTTTVGVLLLLAMQFLASFRGVTLRGGIFGLILSLVVLLLGTAYALAESENLGLRWIGMVFGVGLAEEVIKLIPLAWLLIDNVHRRIGLHSFLAVGFASGLGFGVTEGWFFYSPWEGNLRAGDNLIRWFACVPSHGLWTAASAAVLWKISDRLRSASGLWGRAGVVAVAAGAMALLHGTYNTLCSLGTLAAVAGDLAAVAAVAWLVCKLTGYESDPPRSPEQPGLRRIYRLPAMGGILAAAALLGFFALSGTKSLLEALIEQQPWIAPYVAGLEQEGKGKEDAEVSVALCLRYDQELRLIRGRLENRSEWELKDLCITCRAVHGQCEDLRRDVVQPGEGIDIDPEDEWYFEPGEQIQVRWEGEGTGVTFRVR